MPGMKKTVAAAMIFAAYASYAQAGGPNTYSTGLVEGPSITTYTAAQPILETYGAPVAQPMEAIPYAQPAPVQYVQPPVQTRDTAYYNARKYGGNNGFGYKQSHACGGVLDGEHCLVILLDHMRRLRLDREAGTILVGNPLIADVTVLGKDTVFVSARSIGSTNLIALDKNGNEIGSYEIFVREPRTKRVVLRNLDTVETYQCAPHCLRARAQSDSADSYGAVQGVVSSDISLNQMAIGMQTGQNPSQNPPAPASNPGPVAVPVGQQSSNAAPAAAMGGIPQQAAQMSSSLLNQLAGMGLGASPAGAQQTAQMNGGFPAPPIREQ